MSLRLTGLLAAGVLLGGAAAVQAQGPDVGSLTRELTGEGPAPKRTQAQLDAVYAKVLDALMPDMGSEDPGRRSRSQDTLERIAFRAGRPGAEADRAACAKALAAKLGPDVPAPARVWILRQIERIGRAEVVAQVAKVLGERDALVRESARRALMKNPSGAANQALRKALASADTPEWRIAVINALAERRDPSNVSALLKDAASDDDAVRSAAIIGLAETGTRSAAGPIEAAMTKGPARARRIATDAYLRLAGALAAAGDKASALAMYKKMLPRRGYLKCAALIGVGRTGGTAELPILFEALADPDVTVRGAGIEALTLMPAGDAADAIAAKARTAGPEIKPPLLRALALRGDEHATPILLAAAGDADEDVQAEAIRGLGLAGDATAVPLLLKVAAAAGKPQEIARKSLQRIRADGIDKALLDTVTDKDPKVRLEVVRALSGRHVTAAAPALLKAAEDSDGDVRREAIRALGAVAGTDSLPAVAALLLATGDDRERSEAADALTRIAGRERDVAAAAAPILKALGSAGEPAKLLLLGVLGRIGGPQSLAAVRAAVGDGGPKVKEAAIRALAEWPDAGAADDLLAVARSAPNETLRVIAVRGYIRVCRIRSDRPREQTAKMLIAGLEAAQRPDEKKSALAGLAEAPHILSLQAVVPCMDQDALKEEAAAAATRIGRDIWNSHPQAVKAAMEKVLQVSGNDRRKREAQEALGNAERKLKETKPRS